MDYLRVTFVILLQLGISLNKVQRYNPNIDFLIHEAGGITTAPKRDYAADFPPLKPSLTTAQQSKTTQSVHTPATTPKTQAPKRDYVAPQLPTNDQNRINNQKTILPHGNITPSLSTNPSGSTNKPLTPPRRDYVAPQFPTKEQNVAKNQKTTQIQGNITPSPPTKPTSPKRDYVAPQFPVLKPIQDHNRKTMGNVKDLINYYDNLDQNQNNNPRKPSYSSITQGSSSGTLNAGSVINTPPKHTPKPVSFSTVVAGSSTHTVNPTPGTSAHKSTISNDGKATQPTARPVLPSSIINNNNNQGSGSTVTNAELQILSEELLRKDINNAAKYLTINYQEKTSSQSNEDKAPQPLLTVAPDVWNITTIEKFLPLLDNYERDTLVNEYVTPQERTEENAFMDAIMSTTVIRHLMNFLKDKGYVTPDPRQQRDYLKQLWFGLYSRGKGKISSSGFEHIFLSELKTGEVIGLHNWIYFAKEESANRINYLGYLKYLQLNDKGVVLKLHFNQQGINKPVNTMFIGTSPEFEIALYTVCFVTRQGDDCQLKLGNKDVNIITHNFRYRSKNFIGSAYPQI
ncbi:endoribonuclease CG2145-like [Battus philenor]|uniref:endoribonuclease CG2145-like n=1 Tax=Battus philenor TaxID=42288 RepID=UPI0035CEFC5E